MRNARAWFAAIGLLGMLGLVTPGRARAQGAVAFSPQVGTIPDGVGLSATPAVSADRRYVRLSLGVGFQTVAGFQSIGIPAAVGGSGGGFGGGGGGAVGFRSVLTGMNGPITPGMPGGLAPGPAMMGPNGHGSDFGSGFGGQSFADSFALDQAAPRAVPRRSRASPSRANGLKKAATAPATSARTTPRAPVPPGG